MATGDEVTAAGSEGDACTSPPGWHADEREHRRRERKFWTAYIALTALTVVGAFVGAFFAYGAYVASKQAVAEAKRQANAAEFQIDVARDTEHRQLRAYLHINHGPITVSDNTASAEIRISHSGQTPAYKIKREADIHQWSEFKRPAVGAANASGGFVPIVAKTHRRCAFQIPLVVR
jgi:hypothetical protein